MARSAYEWFKHLSIYSICILRIYCWSCEDYERVCLVSGCTLGTMINVGDYVEIVLDY